MLKIIPAIYKEGRLDLLESPPEGSSERVMCEMANLRICAHSLIRHFAHWPTDLLFHEICARILKLDHQLIGGL